MIELSDRRLMLSLAVVCAATLSSGTLGTAPVAGAQAAPAMRGDSLRYAPAIARLDSLVAREVADKRLPGLSIALVDDQRTVWSRGYGRERAAPADK